MREKESKLWKDSVSVLNKVRQGSIGAAQKGWDNYLKVLGTYFRKMSRLEQEDLITKYSWIITMGAAAWTWCAVYPLFHFIPAIFLIAFPVTMFLAYWFGKKIVSNIMIERLQKYLNDD
jgi:hypothetical protein